MLKRSCVFLIMALMMFMASQHAFSIVALKLSTAREELNAGYREYEAVAGTSGDAVTKRMAALKKIIVAQSKLAAITSSQDTPDLQNDDYRRIVRYLQRESELLDTLYAGQQVPHGTAICAAYFQLAYTHLDPVFMSGTTAPIIWLSEPEARLTGAGDLDPGEIIIVRPRPPITPLQPPAPVIAGGGSPNPPPPDPGMWAVVALYQKEIEERLRQLSSYGQYAQTITKLIDVNKTTNGTRPARARYVQIESPEGERRYFIIRNEEVYVLAHLTEDAEHQRLSVQAYGGTAPLPPPRLPKSIFPPPLQWESVSLQRLSVNGNQAPVADAGQTQTIRQGVPARLNGTRSFDPDHAPHPLTYQWSLLPEAGWSQQYGSRWTQKDGAAIELTDASTATPVLQVKGVEKSVKLKLRLTVSDSVLSDADTVTITVESPSPTENNK